MPVTPMFITKQHFESAMIELAYHPELFDTFFEEDAACQLTTGYLAFACSCVKFSLISDEICKVHVCHFLKSQKIRELLTIVLFVDGSPTRSNFETVATLLVEVAYTRFIMRSRELQKSFVN